MSCPQSESAANHRSSAPPIKNRQFFVKVFYLFVFCKVVFGEIKSNRRILRFFQAFHHPVLFRALVRRFFCRRADLSLSRGFSPFRCCAQGLSSIFSACRRVFPFCAAIYAPVTPRRHLLALCKPAPTIRALHALKARNSPHSPPLRPARDDSLLLSHARRTDAFHAGTLVSALPHPSRARMANRAYKSSSPAPLLRISTLTAFPKSLAMKGMRCHEV